MSQQITSVLAVSIGLPALCLALVAAGLLLATAARSTRRRPLVAGLFWLGLVLILAGLFVLLCPDYRLQVWLNTELRRVLTAQVVRL